MHQLLNETHTHMEGPKVTIKDNGLWLRVAMAIERRKERQAEWS